MLLQRLRFLSGRPHRPTYRLAVPPLQRAGASTCQHSQSKLLADLNNPDNDVFAIYFDDRDVWAQHCKLTPKNTATGLFQNPHFVSSSGLEFAAKESIQRAKILVERICNAPENGSQEMRQVVKNLDRLSDTLCSVIDIAIPP